MRLGQCQQRRVGLSTHAAQTTSSKASVFQKASRHIIELIFVYASERGCGCKCTLLTVSHVPTKLLKQKEFQVILLALKF